MGLRLRKYALFKRGIRGGGGGGGGVILGMQNNNSTDDACGFDGSGDGEDWHGNDSVGEADGISDDDDDDDGMAMTVITAQWWAAGVVVLASREQKGGSVTSDFSTISPTSQVLIDSINRRRGGERGREGERKPWRWGFQSKVCICDDLQSGWLNEPGSELDNLLFPYYFPSFNSLCASIIVHFLVRVCSCVCVCVCVREWDRETQARQSLTPAARLLFHSNFG